MQRRAPLDSADLAKDPYYRWLNNNFLLLQLPLAGTAVLDRQRSPVPAAGPWCCGASPCAWCSSIT